MWNYRVCATTQSGIYLDGNAWKNIEYSFREAYYNNAGNIWAVTTKPVIILTDIMDDDLEDPIDNLGLILQQMQLAITKPVIDLDTFVFADEDEAEDEDEDEYEEEIRIT